MSLIYEHMKLDMEEKIEEVKTPEGVEGEDYNTLESEHERYHDPGFEEIWNSDEEYEKELQELTKMVGENESFEERQPKGQVELPSDLSIEDEWEEVE